MFVSAGFDGSSTDDFTVIRVETMDYWQFTPTYGTAHRQTVWAPQEWGGVIPRAEVHAAVAELFAVERVFAPVAAGIQPTDVPPTFTS